MNKKFKQIMIQNILYLIGCIIGLLIFNLYKEAWIPFLTAELLATMYSIVKTDIIRMKLKKTKELKSTQKTYIQFGIISFFTNMMQYIDKFLIYPTLGSTAVAVYYSTTTLSRITSMIINPISGVLLSWISNVKENKRDKIITKAISASVPLAIISFVVCLPFSYIAIKLLYVQYYTDAIKILVLVCITAAIADSATIIKTVLLKYCPTKNLTKIYIIYFVTFSILAILLSKLKGLNGFCISNLIAKIELWSCFVIMLYKQKKKGAENE